MLSNRTRETTTTTGTGTINLGGAVSGYQTFVAGIGTGNVCYYVIEDSSTGDWEIGIGTVTDASPDTLSRDTVVESSNADALVDFGAGTKNVWTDAVIQSGALAVNGLRVTNGSDILTLTVASNQVNFAALALSKYYFDNDIYSGTTNIAALRAFEFIFDGGGAVLTPGIKALFRVPFDCTIVRVSLQSGQAGDLKVDIWKDSFANSPPTNADTITAGTEPELSSADTYEDETLTGWTIALSEGDVLAINIDSVATIELATLELKVRPT